MYMAFRWGGAKMNEHTPTNFMGDLENIPIVFLRGGLQSTKIHLAFLWGPKMNENAPAPFVGDLRNSLLPFYGGHKSNENAPLPFLWGETVNQ